MKSIIYNWLPKIFGCHCMPERSFFYKNQQFPLCARCTGELLGIFFSLILLFFWKPSLKVSGLMMIPLIVDGFVQRLSTYESTNVRRVITGILFGIGITSIIVQTTLMALNYGIDIGRSLR